MEWTEQDGVDRTKRCDASPRNPSLRMVTGRFFLAETQTQGHDLPCGENGSHHNFYNQSNFRAFSKTRALLKRNTNLILSQVDKRHSSVKWSKR